MHQQARRVVGELVEGRGDRQELVEKIERQLMSRFGAWASGWHWAAGDPGGPHSGFGRSLVLDRSHSSGSEWSFGTGFGAGLSDADHLIQAKVKALVISPVPAAVPS